METDAFDQLDGIFVKHQLELVQYYDSGERSTFRGTDGRGDVFLVEVEIVQETIHITWPEQMIRSLTTTIGQLIRTSGFPVSLWLEENCREWESVDGSCRIRLKTLDDGRIRMSIYRFS